MITRDDLIELIEVNLEQDKAVGSVK